MSLFDSAPPLRAGAATATKRNSVTTPQRTLFSAMARPWSALAVSNALPPGFSSARSSPPLAPANHSQDAQPHVFRGKASHGP